MYGSNLQPYSRVVHLQSEEWNANIQMSQMIPCPAVHIPDGGLSFSWVGCVMRGGGGVNQSSFRHISWCTQVRKMKGNERNRPLTPLPARSGTTIPHQIHLSIHPSSNHMCTLAHVQEHVALEFEPDTVNQWTIWGGEEEKKVFTSLQTKGKSNRWR